MIAKGYILLARKLLKSNIMDKPPLHFKLWCWMLMQAQYRDDKKLQKGQFITSIGAMREAMAYKSGYRKETPTVKQIRGAYGGLLEGTMIGTTKVTGGMLITILNYKEYQDMKNYGGHDEGHDGIPTGGTRRGTSYLLKEMKELKERDINISLPADAPSDIPKIISQEKNEIEKFCSDFIDHIKKTKPTLAPRSENILKNSYVVINKIINIDGVPFEQVVATMSWAVRDDFWSGNLFSLAALRKKSDNGLTKFQNIQNSMGKASKPKIHKLNNQNKAAGKSFIERMRGQRNA